MTTQAQTRRRIHVRRLTADEHTIVDTLDPDRLPYHIAIIMDGNRRWAAQHKFDALRGHREGARTTRQIIEVCADLGIKILSLYTFSTENWNRPKHEVDGLMRLIAWNLQREREELKRNGIRVRHIGRREGLPRTLLNQIDRCVSATRDNEGMILNLAVNYGGRTEIADAVRRIAAKVAEGVMQPDAIDEDAFSRYLFTCGERDPDLLIRTGGEMRISNFLLWQMAYTELWITPTYWPDFQKSDLLRAVADYQKRERRFGSSGTRHVGGKRHKET